MHKNWYSATSQNLGNTLLLQTVGTRRLYKPTLHTHSYLAFSSPSPSPPAMPPENKLALVPQPSYTTEFRSFNDDAWYSVAISLESQMQLRIKYSNFSDDHDDVFEASQFETQQKLDLFIERFRPLSRQLQDYECHQLRQGVRVCACHRFSNDDVRFYDAEVDSVQQNEHSFEAGEELCSCRFVLSWLHGPNEGKLTHTTIDSICLVQPVVELDPVLTSFLVARETAECLLARPISMAKEVFGREIVVSCNERPTTVPRLGYFERNKKEKRRAKRSVVKSDSSEVRRRRQRMGESDLEGLKNQCAILIGNVEKELGPLAVANFLHAHIEMSPRVFIFPSCSSEIYTKAAIVLDTEKDFQKLCEFLDNHNHIITSSTGRPWVIMEKLVGLKKIKASLGTLLPESKVGEFLIRFLAVANSENNFKACSDMRIVQD
ncbi:hypothetical protein Ahy_B05g073790 [Arachis hypogaea]|uniref:SAWADEE domain-containing protein n=1 Tax=Arachis hypogaea TaxID=3818 RepID=A0A444YX45_ARAHY|nr:hypothetical protein Ahy_B05g073790 [Arachis hypogaea]